MSIYTPLCSLRLKVPSFFNPSELQHGDIPLIVKILRMSTKYQVPALRKRAIDVLLRWYPTTLDAYKEEPTCENPLRDRYAYARHVMVANVARETDALVLLPTALFLCCASADASTLYDGMIQDGTYHLLSDRNKRAVVLGRPRLSHAARTRTHSFLFRPQARGGFECRRTACADFCNIYTSVLDDKEDPFINPFRRIVWESLGKACCTPCIQDWMRVNREASLEVWQELPSFFDLPPWQELTKVSGES